MKMSTEAGEITINYYKDFDGHYVVETELWYPRVKDPGCVDTVIVDLLDVRAAPPIKVQYDFKRDGYVIYRRDDDYEGEGFFWVEKAFIHANDEDA